MWGETLAMPNRRKETPSSPRRFARKAQKPRIVALVPMKADSERIPHKNTRLFNGKPLYHYILNALSSCRYIEEIHVNTDSMDLMAEIPRHFEKANVIPRPRHLCGHSVPMNDILLYDIGLVKADWYLQTHATNPLLRTRTITRSIELLLASPEYDSLFSVTPLQVRLWDKDGKPMNHDPAVLGRTQDLDPVFEENSNIYIFTAESLLKRRNRIGEEPLIFQISREEAWDIDEELDFLIAEFLLKTVFRRDLVTKQGRKH